MRPDDKVAEFLAASARQVRLNTDSFSHTVPSPCLSVCQMDADSGLCQGCLRTLEEVARWGSSDDTYKRTVWANIEARIDARPT